MDLRMATATRSREEAGSVQAQANGRRSTEAGEQLQTADEYRSGRSTETGEQVRTASGLAQPGEDAGAAAWEMRAAARLEQTSSKRRCRAAAAAAKSSRPRPSLFLSFSGSLPVKLPAPAVNGTEREISRARAYMRSLSAAGLLAQTRAQFPSHPWSISHPFPAESHPASAAVL